MVEKRRTSRKPISLRLDVSCGANMSESATVQTINLSKSGALVESPVPLFVGEICTFSLRSSSGQKTSIRGHVIWVTKLDNGTFQGGVAFRNLTADEEYFLDLQLARGGG